MLEAATGYRTDEVAGRLADAPRHDDANLAAEREGLEPDTLHPLDVMRELDRAMPAGASLVIGVGHFWWFPAVTLTRPDPSATFYTYDFGTIGQAMPTAIGVAVATGRPVVVVDGDGSFLMNIQELETVARERIPLTVVVLNDGAYGAEVHRLGARGGDPDLARFGRPDLAAVARAFGLGGARLAAPGDLGRAIATAGGTSLVIDVPMSDTVVSEPYQRMFYGGVSDASRAGKA
jgi:thiamine pyrophosphate-dependent acetolactate synthase large subunit-like protein